MNDKNDINMRYIKIVLPWSVYLACILQTGTPIKCWNPHRRFGEVLQTCDKHEHSTTKCAALEAPAEEGRHVGQSCMPKHLEGQLCDRLNPLGPSVRQLAFQMDIELPPPEWSTGDLNVCCCSGDTCNTRSYAMRCAHVDAGVYFEDPIAEGASGATAKIVLTLLLFAVPVLILTIPWFQFLGPYRFSVAGVAGVVALGVLVAFFSTPDE